MILPILHDGHPILAKRARKVTEFNTPFLVDLVNNMWETMIDAKGIGLAAPQIGVSLCVIVFGDNKEIPQTILINPKVEPIGETQASMPEGCLSVPERNGFVVRPSCVYYSGYDVHRRLIEREVDGWHARVVQHEYDHLKGILFTERIQEQENENAI